MRAMVFPGQGSQAIGMGKAIHDNFAEAKEVFQEVDEVLKQHLSTLMFEGEIEELTLTENAQPALMACSMAIVRVLEKQGGKQVSDLASFVAGHSLGEYTALAAAGALTLSDAARLLKTRGTAMQQAVPQGQGGMAAVIGLEYEVAEEIAQQAAEGETLQIANDNSPGQIVLSGTSGAIARGEALAKERGAKRYLPLNVSAPFHSALMQPAADVMAQALSEVEMASPAVPLVANVTAEQVSDPLVIKDLLVQQVTGRVRWRESVEYLAKQGVAETLEVGSGKVLSGLIKRINRELSASNLETPEAIEAFLQGL